MSSEMDHCIYLIGFFVYYRQDFMINNQDITVIATPWDVRVIKSQTVVHTLKNILSPLLIAVSIIS